jgi:hypothetical protein
MYFPKRYFRKGLPNPQGGDRTQAYIAMMWRDGPLALGISSALFFVLIRWAVGLTRVRLLVFEETEAQKKPNEKTAA